MTEVMGTRSGAIEREWGDGLRMFRLGVGEWEKIDEICKLGPGEMLARLGAFVAARRAYPGVPLLDLALAGGLGSWRRLDVRTVLLQGLIGGGGCNPTEAAKLVKELEDERPAFENVPLAFDIVQAAVIGPEGEPLGKSPGETEDPLSPRSPTEG